MAIDGIGKKAGLPPASGPGGAAPSERAPAGEERFEVRKQAPAEVANVQTEPTPLERLRRGEIDLNAYLDAKVDKAVSHLHGLGAVELDSMKKMLRDQLSSDPTLAELLRTATGKLPPPSED